jgi:hypothetical protein
MTDINHGDHDVVKNTSAAENRGGKETARIVKETENEG